MPRLAFKHFIRTRLNSGIFASCVKTLYFQKSLKYLPLEDRERKLMDFRQHYNMDRAHQSPGGDTPEEVSIDSQPRRAKLSNYSWVYHTVTDFFRHPLLHELLIPHPHVPTPIDTPVGASQARSCFMAIKYRGDKPLLQVNGTCSLQFFQKLPGHIRRKFQCTICTRIQRIINASEGTLFELLSGLG